MVADSAVSHTSHLMAARGFMNVQAGQTGSRMAFPDTSGFVAGPVLLGGADRAGPAALELNRRFLGAVDDDVDPASTSRKVSVVIGGDPCAFSSSDSRSSMPFASSSTPSLAARSASTCASAPEPQVFSSLALRSAAFIRRLLAHYPPVITQTAHLCRKLPDGLPAFASASEFSAAVHHDGRLPSLLCGS